MQNNLKSLRKRAGKTQAQMASDLGVAVSTIQNWESDRTEMTGYSLVMVAEYLNVPVSEVFTTDNRKTEYFYIELNSKEDELVKHFDQSSEEGQDRILEYAKMIAREHPKE